MLKYNSNLKQSARRLRTTLTDSEQALWSRLRRKQICGVLFYRQKPIGGYIVDFYSFKAKMVIEIDGSQHFEPHGAGRDKQRDSYLAAQGLRVLRFNNLQVLREMDAVLDSIYRVVMEQLSQNPPSPLCKRGVTQD